MSEPKMENMNTSKKIKTPKGSNRKPAQTIKHDAIHPKDYNSYIIPMACEDCTHYSLEETRCTLGYNNKWHLREYQQKSYELSGKVPICRFMEID